MSDTATLNAVAPVLMSRDIARTADFYTRHLGFETVSTYPNYLIMRRDAVRLHFTHAPGNDPLKNDCSAYVFATDVTALYTRAQAAGVVHPNGPLRDQDYGLRDFAVLDPDGNLLTFGEAM